MKRFLLGCVAATAMLGFAGSAMAWDRSVTDWDWYKNKYETVIIKTWIWGFFDPTGETEVKSVQTYIGNVTAGAVLMGDYAPYELSIDKSVTSGEFSGDFHGYLDGFADLHGKVVDENCWGCYDEDPVYMHGPVDGYLYGWFGGSYSEYSFDFHFAKILQDANVGLGHATQTVSAAGIVQQVESAVPIYAFMTQELFGDYGGLAEITAYAIAGSKYDPVELAVDQSVSAVAEIISLEVAAAGPGVYLDPEHCFYGYCKTVADPFAHVRTDLIIEADITQFAKADTSAYASLVQDLSSFTGLANYTGLGEDMKGLVAAQSVSAAGLVSSIKNAVVEP